jgi:hypothetical protein
METLLIIGGVLPVSVVQSLGEKWGLVFLRELPERLPESLDVILLWDRGDTVGSVLNLRLRTQAPILVIGNEFPYKSIEAGADRYVKRDASPEELAVQVESVIRYALLHLVPPLLQRCWN